MNNYERIQKAAALLAMSTPQNNLQLQESIKIIENRPPLVHNIEYAYHRNIFGNEKAAE